MNFFDRKRISRTSVATALGALCIAGFAACQQAPVAPAQQAAGGQVDRTVLPIAQPARQTYTEVDARNAKPPARFDVTAPAGAPNVLVILLDDVGFGAASTFGGPVPTPTLERLAQQGLRYNNFHTTALCSPTRMALKTGRNHHTGETGSIMETATAFPGNTGQLPNSVAPVAEMLRLNGYSTGAFGKWHETAAWETSVSGPFDRWPTHQGFDKFYGFIGGETNHWAPFLFDGVTQVELPADPNYHFLTEAEVYAAFLEMTDDEVGRIVSAIDGAGDLDNTLIFYIVGDNGASAEGGMVGMFNEMTYFNGVAEQVPDLVKLMDKWGGPDTYPHMAAGWAVAFDTPFMWTKQVASSFGGTRNGMVISWPKGVKARGEVRSQFHHVIDVVPTILEAATLPEPKSVNGTPQTPIEGVSMAYTFADAKAKGRHLTQYFEIFGNRAIYHDGWLAGTVHKAPSSLI